MTRWLRPDEDALVRALYRRVHPDWPERPPHWFQAHPTLVIEGAVTFRGYACLSVIVGTDGTWELRGMDLGVAHEHQSQGLGRALADARLRVGREIGAARFVGITAFDNAAMLAIFRAQGFRFLQAVPAYFPDRKDGEAWGGDL